MRTRRIELWADSFHEGDWACRHLKEAHVDSGGPDVPIRYLKGFIPEYRFQFADCTLVIEVYGSYDAWSPMPTKVKELLAWGKPDLIAYDAANDQILFAVEETAAVPTGNQALQRCERLYGASRARIPFWYLLAEYGVHKDEGLRRDSIWPTVMALKLSLHNHSPCVILHYSDRDNPEGYDFGNGVESLFSALYSIIENSAADRPALHGLEATLKAHYADMLRFVGAQYRNIIEHIPGLEHFVDERLPGAIVEITCGGGEERKAEFVSSYLNWLAWPDVAAWHAQTTKRVKAAALIKHDGLAALAEGDIDLGHCYVISSNAGSRPQKNDKLSGWIETQNASFARAAAAAGIDARLDLCISQFPKSASGNHHVTTAKNILYLFDEARRLNELIGKTYPRLVGRIPELDNDRRAMLYISNSVKPGRIFGDPFTGQISAYSTVFGKFDVPPRLVVAYFPHQSFAQFTDTRKKLGRNKGYVLMRELVDVVILGGGVAVRLGPSKGTAI